MQPWLGADLLAECPNFPLHWELPEDTCRPASSEQGHGVQKRCDGGQAERQPLERSAVNIGAVVSHKVIDIVFNRRYFGF